MPTYTNGNQANDVIERIDQYTGEIATFKKSFESGLSADNIIIINFDGNYYVRQITGAINCRWFGAKGDGIFDDTESIQKCINFAAEKSENSAVLLDRVFRIKKLSIIEKKGLKLFSNNKGGLQKINNLETDFVFINKSQDINFDSLTITGSNENIVGGSGIYYHNIRVNESKNIKFSNCIINNSIRGGILATKSSNIWVLESCFYDNSGMFDVSFGYDISDNTRTDNFHCYKNQMNSNNAYGIHCMGGGENYFVKDNYISNKKEYGIVFYHLGEESATNEINNVNITNNLVEDVSDFTNTDSKGMGIYLQTINKVIVSNNIVKRVLQNRNKNSVNRQLPPAAISINGCREVVCSGNYIEDSLLDGIGVANSSGESKGTIISNNIINSVGKIGVYLNTVNNIILAENILIGKEASANHQVTEPAIYLVSSSARNTSNITITGNRIKSGFREGIHAYKSTGLGFADISITNNVISDSNLYYCYVENCSNLSIIGNTMKNSYAQINAGGSAIRIKSNSNFIITNNLISADNSHKISRGIQSDNNTFGIISHNVIKNISESNYIISSINDNSVIISNNLNE